MTLVPAIVVFVLVFLAFSKDVGTTKRKVRRNEENRKQREKEISALLNEAGNSIALSGSQTQLIQQQTNRLRENSREKLDSLRDIVEDL